MDTICTLLAIATAMLTGITIYLVIDLAIALWCEFAPEALVPDWMDRLLDILDPTTPEYFDDDENEDEQ